jgi:hypothetical protein
LLDKSGPFVAQGGKDRRFRVMSANRARALFIELVAQAPPEAWESRLAELAGVDQELHGRVAALLAAHREADSFLEQPAAPLGNPG